MTQAFNLSQFANKVNTSGQADLTSAVTGVLPVANGGTNASSLTGNTLMVANSGGTAIGSLANGTSGHVLTAGAGAPTWQAPTVGGQNIQLFTSNTTWTPPSGVTKCIVHAIGGGGGGGFGAQTGGNGGYICAYVTGLSGSVNITIGTGGNSWYNASARSNGGDTTFGTYVTAGGGVGTGNSGSYGSTGTTSTASSGGVTVTTISAGNDSIISVNYKIATINYYYTYIRQYPFFGGSAQNGVIASSNVAVNNIIPVSSPVYADLRSSWNNTSAISAGSGGGCSTSITTVARDCGVAGAMVIIY